MENSATSASLPKSLRQSFVRKVLVWLAPVLMLLLTLIAAYVVDVADNSRVSERFQYRAEKERLNIVVRMQAYEQVLRGAAAFLESGQTLSREAWRRYVAGLALEKNLPGIQGTGFVLMVAPADKAEHEWEMRTDGFSDYAIRPDGVREQYSSVVFLEPFAKRNLRAFGYDMFAEPIRRAAMERARDTGQPALSGKVKLTQETVTDVQPGFLIYVPVYRYGLPRESVEQRRAALIGFAFSPFRARDLIGNVVGQESKDVELELYDGDVQAENLLYASFPGRQETAHRHSADLAIDFGGHRWTARLRSRPEFDRVTVSYLPISIFVGGGLLSLMFFSILLMNVRHQRRLEVMNAELAESEAQFRLFFEKNSSVMLMIDPVSGVIINANQAAAVYYGFAPERLIGVLITEINTLPSELVAAERALALREERNFFNFRHRLANGEIRDVEVYATPYEIAGKTLLFSIVHDISERKRAEVALRESEMRWQFALQGAGDGVWDWDIQTGMAHFSRRWKEMLGHAEDEIGSASEEWIKRVHPDDMPQVMVVLNEHLEGKTPSATTEHRLRCKDGNWKWVLGRGMAVSRDEAGKPTRIVGTNTDISEQKRLEAELTRQAHLDYLTGVSSRGHFMEQAERELHRAIRYDKDISLFMMDIDFFKRVNDRHGHKTGDLVLKKLVEVCLATLREADIVGRVGGEEFAVLLPEIGKSEAVEVAERLRVAIAETRVPIEQGLPIHFTVSIGVASMASQEDNIDVLLSQADKALYQAKNGGRNKVCLAAL